MWCYLSSKCWVSPACMPRCQKPSKHPMPCQSSTSLSPVTPVHYGFEFLLRKHSAWIKKGTAITLQTDLNPEGRLVVGHSPHCGESVAWRTLILEAKGSGDVLQLVWKPYLQLVAQKADELGLEGSFEVSCSQRRDSLHSVPVCAAATPPGLTSPFRGNVTPFFPCLLIVSACNISSSTGGTWLYVTLIWTLPSSRVAPPATALQRTNAILPSAPLEVCLISQLLLCCFPYMRFANMSADHNSSGSSLPASLL